MEVRNILHNFMVGQAEQILVVRHRIFSRLAIPVRESGRPKMENGGAEKDCKSDFDAKDR